MSAVPNDTTDLRLALLETAIRNTERRGFHERLAAFVRMAVALFLILLVVRCFGSWGGIGLDVSIAVLFVFAGFVERVVGPSRRAKLHALAQKGAYDMIACLEEASGDEEKLSTIAKTLVAIRSFEPPSGAAARTRALRAARQSLGLPADGPSPKIVAGAI